MNRPEHEPEPKATLQAFSLGILFGALNTLIIVIVLKIIALALPSNL